MSLDEARQAAILREGHAKAKYHFTAQSGMEISFRKVTQPGNLDNFFILLAYCFLLSLTD